MKASMEGMSKYMEMSSNMLAKSWEVYMNGLNTLYQSQEQMLGYYQQGMDKAKSIGEENQKIAENMIKQARETQLQYQKNLAEAVNGSISGMPAMNLDYFKDINSKIAEMMQYGK